MLISAPETICKALAVEPSRETMVLRVPRGLSPTVALRRPVTTRMAEYLTARQAPLPVAEEIHDLVNAESLPGGGP
jgi:hypothetical protein